MSEDLARLVLALQAGERRALGKAITLVESERVEDRVRALELLGALPPARRAPFRIGVTGAPGVGKSTLVDALGLQAIEAGKRVAVLAIDPSSAKTGGSLLGDRTRMRRLAASPAAFVRPTPSSGAAGGIAKRSREAILVAESAGYNVVIVETVGVGQGELAIADCVDLVLLLWMPGSGDDVQGMKRGILEHADVVAFTKADGDTLAPARAGSSQLAALFASIGRAADVLAVSALSQSDSRKLWDVLSACHARIASTGELEQRRAAQRGVWLRDALQEALAERMASRADLDEERQRLERAVLRGEVLPPLAARSLVARV